MSVDPLAEQFPGWTPYHYVHNNPINMTDPTGMSAESSGPGKKKQSTAEMVYNHTGFKRAVDWVSDLFTPAEPQKLLRFTKDVETTMVMKNGGGQNDRTTGTSGGETNVDKVTDASPSFKPSTKGKGIVEIVGDLIGGYQAGAGAGEAVDEITIENTKRTYISDVRNDGSVQLKVSSEERTDTVVSRKEEANVRHHIYKREGAAQETARKNTKIN
ncbi:hypothetical protein L1275_000879 [Flavobacterium sp. HSC-61S13]|nr:hypothetical protein [Flavobacterium sp. HSC-61S13]